MLESSLSPPTVAAKGFKVNIYLCKSSCRFGTENVALCGVRTDLERASRFCYRCRQSSIYVETPFRTSLCAARMTDQNHE